MSDKPSPYSYRVKSIVKTIDGDTFDCIMDLGFDVLFVDGHTEKQMIPIINFKGQKIAFAADLIPTAGHVPLPYIPGYDIRPLTSLKEKESFLNFCNDNNVLLFFEHDAFEELGLVHQTEHCQDLDAFQ